MAKSKKLKEPAASKTAAANTPSTPKVPRNVLKFSKFVARTLWQHKRLFGALTVVALVASLVITGASQQQQYASLRDLTLAVTGELGVSNGVLESIALLISLIGGGLNVTLGEGQQIGQLMVYLLLWLTTIWLLRHVLAGHKAVKVRDGLYNAAAPMVPTLVIATIGLVQLLPAAGAILALAAAKASGLLEGALGIAILVVVASVVGALSLYWLTTTFIAGVIATIPGTYPVNALRSARTVVKGHRVSLLLHMIWLVAGLAVLSSVLLLPVILVDTSTESSWLPLVALFYQLLTTAALVYATAYVYLLYRGMIDD